MEIYVFQYKDLYKIGVSNDSKIKLLSFPFMEMVFCKDFENARSIEKSLHDKFSFLRITDDFFEDKNKEILNYLKAGIQN